VACGPGVKIISKNHDLYDIWSFSGYEDVHIGNYCWLGANSVILPGVILGDHTIVGAGAVVTKSFPKGYCVIVGNPARQIKKIKKELCKENMEA
jgi:acetyltransferase-like isoleucine patch superfamily enzyme